MGDKLIQVTALTSGRHSPSSRFRVRQFISPLLNSGIAVREYYPIVNKYVTKRLAPLGMLARLPGLKTARGSDITWLERELVPEKSTLEHFASTKRVLDVDDAIWLNKAQFSEQIASRCAGVIAGNNFLAAHYRKYGARVWLIPTSVNTDIWRPSASRQTAKWTVGWVGSTSTRKYLQLIEEPLADFLNDHADAELLVVCNRSPSFKRIPESKWRFVRWSPENEVHLAQSMNVGLMPLATDEWSMGKCALKMIQYMAVGIPTIVTPIGVARELVADHDAGFAAKSHDDWYNALNRLYEDTAVVAELGARGRRLVEDQFSVNCNAQKLATIFREIASE